MERETGWIETQCSESQWVCELIDTATCSCARDSQFVRWSITIFVIELRVEALAPSARTDSHLKDRYKRDITVVWPSC